MNKIIRVPSVAEEINNYKKMKGLQITYFTVIATILFFVPFLLFAQKNQVQYKFIVSDTGYTFFGSFESNADPECVLDISFAFKHQKNLAPWAKEIRLDDQGENWNRLCFIVKKFGLFKNTSTWNRVLNQKKLRVDFTLINNSNKSSILPDIISSKGFYQIKKVNESILVKYYQECELTKSFISDIYINQGKKEAIKFLYTFSKYTNTICVN